MFDRKFENDVETNLYEIGQKSKKALLKAGKTPDEIAARMNLSNTDGLAAVIQNGNVQNLHLRTLVRFFLALGYDIEFRFVPKGELKRKKVTARKKPAIKKPDIVKESANPKTKKKDNKK